MNRAAIESFGTRVLNTTRLGLAHLRAAFDKLRPVPVEQADGEGDVEVKELLNEKALEKGISSQLLRISVVAISFKALHYFVGREWLLTVASVISWVLAAPLWMWMTLTGAFIPLICGLVMAIITWFTIFLDRFIPGVYPPSPVLERKFGIPFPSTLHLGYSIGIVNAFILTFLVYSGISDLPNIK